MSRNGHDLERMREAGRNTDSPIPSRQDQLATANELARIRRTSWEAHEAMASTLWRGADDLGRIIAAVEVMGREMWPVVISNESEADEVVISGPDIVKALRTLAMGLDRAVMVKHAKED